MQRITFDHNCILAIENHEVTASCLSKIVDANNASTVSVAVLGISASERTISGDFLTDIDEFLERLKAIGLRQLEVLKPIDVKGVTFWNWSIYASEEDKTLLSTINNIIFPGDELSWPTFAAQFGEDANNKSGSIYRKWRNRHCDVQGLWAHIKNSRDIFVTSDKHFLTKATDLSAIGSKAVLSPPEALARL